jgi:aminocarboxymuconate-semialdehyde decarboxylase
MQDVSLAIGEMERCMQELRMPGLEIGTNVNGKNLGDPEFLPFFKRAEELDCALFIHPWEMMGQKDIQLYWLPWLVGMPAETTRAICSLIFSGVLEKFPRLRLAFAHGGGSFPYTMGRIEHGYHVRPDLVQIHSQVNPRDYFGKFWVDSLVHDPLAFQFLRATMTDDRICLGSDYPFPLGEHRPGALIESMELDAATKEKLNSGNALEGLQIKSQLL